MYIAVVGRLLWLLSVETVQGKVCKILLSLFLTLSDFGLIIFEKFQIKIVAISDTLIMQTVSCFAPADEELLT